MNAQTTIANQDPTARPPKPRLCLRVGVIGHRPKQIPDPKALETGVGEVLVAVMQTLTRVYEENPSVLMPFDEKRASCVRLISSLADGADRIVVEAGRRISCDLQSILPFPAEEFAKDFDEEDKEKFRSLLDTATAVYALPGSRETEHEEQLAYSAASVLTLRQSDIVLAVWDGKEPRGLGGTGESVVEAASANIPVVWIDPSGEFRGVIEGREGRRELPETLARRVSPKTPESVEKVIRRLVEPPSPRDSYHGRNGPTQGQAREQLERFLQEKERRFLGLGILHRVFCVFPGLFFRPIRISLARYDIATAEQWQGFYHAIEQEGVKPPIGLKERVEPRFSWADNLAVFYSEVYRSAFIALYMLAASAVLLSIVSVLNLKHLKFELVSAEILIIFAIAVLAFADNFRAWHKRFLDYRQLAELLRHLRIVTLTGSRANASTVQPLRLDVRPGPRWVGWYYRATLREVSLLDRCPPERLAETVGGIALTAEIDDQINYHESTAHRLERLHFVLEWVGNLLFLSTFIIGLIFIYNVWGACDRPGPWQLLTCTREMLNEDTLDKSMKSSINWITFLGAVLPAFGAGLRSIRVHGEFRESAERSEITANLLKATRKDLLDAIERKDWRSVSDSLDVAMQLMVDEVSVWRFVFHSKRLDLPE